MAWGISPNACEKEKIKAKMNDCLKGYNSIGEISYSVYCELYDFSMKYLDEMYELGKLDSIKWIPLSERLPNTARTVLVCTITENISTDFIECLENGEVTWCLNENVIAWSELPQPYKEV